MKQTAVQEFALALMRAEAIKSSSTNDFIKAHADALQMEKEQKIDFARHCLEKAKDLDVLTSFMNVEQYYNETFKNK